MLRYDTSDDWTKLIVTSIDQFLPDHAAAEKKASGMAMSMISHYPDKPQIVHAMTDLALEELNHYRDVIRIIYKRGLELQPDQKDHYITAIRQLIKNKNINSAYDAYMLDRLLTAAIIEARGAERFGLIAQLIEDAELKRFYKLITDSEMRHNDVFIELAKIYFDEQIIDNRLDELLDAEAKIVEALPLKIALH